MGKEKLVPSLEGKAAAIFIPRRSLQSQMLLSLMHLVTDLLAHLVSMTWQLSLQQLLLDPAVSPAPGQSACKLHDRGCQPFLQFTSIIRIGGLEMVRD